MKMFKVKNSEGNFILASGRNVLEISIRYNLYSDDDITELTQEQIDVYVATGKF